MSNKFGHIFVRWRLKPRNSWFKVATTTSDRTVRANGDRRRIRFQNAYNRSRSRETISPPASVRFQNYLNTFQKCQNKIENTLFYEAEIFTGSRIISRRRNQDCRITRVVCYSTEKIREDGEMSIMARGSTAWLVLKNFVALDWVLWELVKVGNWEHYSTQERKFNTLMNRYTECHVTLWLKHNTRTITTRQYESQLISRFTDVNLTNLRKKWPLTSFSQSESAKVDAE